MHDRRRPRPASPLPGTEQPLRGLFIDRWGTLLEPPARASLHFASTRFVPGALDALFRLAHTPLKLYLIGNEDLVSSGRVPVTEWQSFERELSAHLRQHGVTIARIYACLDDAEHGVAPHDKCSVFRLPDTGIFFHAAQHDGIELRRSFVIGDSSLELTAGVRAGMRTIGVATGTACRDRALNVEPELFVASLAQAVDLFAKSEAYSMR